LVFCRVEKRNLFAALGHVQSNYHIFMSTVALNDSASFNAFSRVFCFYCVTSWASTAAGQRRKLRADELGRDPGPCANVCRGPSNPSRIRSRKRWRRAVEQSAGNWRCGATGLPARRDQRGWRWPGRYRQGGHERADAAEHCRNAFPGAAVTNSWTDLEAALAARGVKGLPSSW